MPAPKTVKELKKALDELKVEYPKTAKSAELLDLWEKATADPVEKEEVPAEETESDYTIQQLAAEINAILEWSPAIIEDGDDDETMEAIMAGETEDDCAAVAIVSADMPIGPCPKDDEGEELPRFTVPAWDFMVENDILKHLGKNAKTVAAATDKPKPKSSGPKAPSTPRYTRQMALAEAAKTETNIKKIIALSSDLYVKNGGKDNINESKWLANMAFGVMISMELVAIKDGELIINK